ncbi:MAG: hypothetical protein AB1671_10080 [Thermodesulfobacteriota bacterium]|jgi:ATP-dependent DNA helicase RecG
MNLSELLQWDDLALEKIRQFMDAVRRAGRRPVPERTGEHEFLEKLELLKDGQLTRAALLLFGKRPTSYFPSAFLKLGRFRSPILIVDDREVEGTLLEQVEEAMSWFRERFQTKFVITGKPQRDTIWEYRLEAVREAIVNAVCHRDYTSPMNIQVRFHDTLAYTPAGEEETRTYAKSLTSPTGSRTVGRRMVPATHREA